MKHRELVNHIKGSFLKRQFLEAFLVQSAYIESLLKLYADFKFFEVTDGKSLKNKFLETLRGNIDKYSLNELINLLYKSDLISDEQRKLLNSYKDRRNRVLHDLIKEIRKNDFEKELEEICNKGNEVIENDKFKEMADILEEVTEKVMEELKSTNVEISDNNKKSIKNS